MAYTDRHLVVISADAMVDADLAYAKTLPHIAWLLENGSQVQHVTSIYPSVTYPAHVTMSSGCWPEKTGVYANEFLQPGNLHPEWLWFHDPVRCEDIFDAAKREGLTTAAVFWPVTGNHRNIDYLVDEYWPQGKGDTNETCFRRSGTSDEVYTRCVAPYVQGVAIRTHPQTDQLIMDIGSAILRTYKPNLLMLHPADIDSARHGRGLFGEHVDQALRDTDRYLGIMMDAAREAGIFESTDFVLMSDHGQMEITRVMNLNVKLAEAGFIDTDEQGGFVDWRAYVKSVGMSAHVYVKDPKDIPAVEAFLSQLLKEEAYGFSEMLTKEEASARYHLSGDFAYVLETDGYTTFGDSWKRPLVRPYDRTDYRHGKATHGYMPEKGPQPIFIAAGPHVAQGVSLEKGLLVQAAPTMAAILGFSLPQAQGTPWTPLLRKA